jgi:16S rRNA (uracil1498-N3)-methyltransferase
MHRFFVLHTPQVGRRLAFDAAFAHQLGHVLRLRVGDHIQFLDDTGWAYEAEIVALDRDEVTTAIVGRSQPDTEPRLRLVLYQAMLPPERWEWLLQKGTELGVSLFIPLITDRTVSRRTPVAEGRFIRWMSIIREAAEQSGRCRMPQVRQPMAFDEALAAWPREQRLIMAALDASATPLREALSAGLTPEVGLMVGPEGDFTPAEVAAARERGASIVSLGKRVLRAETAPLAALSAILYAAGEM